jgi:hypothetical protein
MFGNSVTDPVVAQVVSSYINGFIEFAVCVLLIFVEK